MPLFWYRTIVYTSSDCIMHEIKENFPFYISYFWLLGEIEVKKNLNVYCYINTWRYCQIEYFCVEKGLINRFLHSHIMHCSRSVKMATPTQCNFHYATNQSLIHSIALGFLTCAHDICLEHKWGTNHRYRITQPTRSRT